MTTSTSGRIIPAMLAAIFVFAAVACGRGNAGGEAGETGSVAADMAPDNFPEPRTPVLTADSLGPVHVGMPVDSLPAAVSMLYDEMSHSSESDYTEYLFSLEGTPMFTVLDFGEGTVDVISLVGDRIGAQSGDSIVRIGDMFGKVLGQRDTHPEWAGYDAVGRWTWTCGGLWFMPDETMGNGKRARRLVRRMYDSMEAPDPEEFGEDVTIGYIGTGLPF